MKRLTVGRDLCMTLRVAWTWEAENVPVVQRNARVRETKAPARVRPRMGG